jgi:hypothetical protein
MLGLFSFSRPTTLRPQRPPLFVERLEDRNCPTTLSLNADVLPGHYVKLSGYATDGNIAGVVVTFSGAVSASTITDATGFYSLTTSNASLGTVYADGINLLQQPTNTAGSRIAVTAPNLTMQIVSIQGQTVSIKGNVLDLDSGSFDITLGGVASTTVTPDSKGDFTAILNVSGLGALTASATDLWGQSDDLALDVTNYQPMISSFCAIYESSGVWTFRGRVDDEYAAGLTVRFGGLGSLQGKTATVDADGWFTLTCVLNPGETGTATACVTDWWNIESEIATAIVC